MIVNQNWTVFEGEPFKYNKRSEPRITLGVRNTFYMNLIAWETMGAPGAVELLYDGNRRKIGMRPVDPRRKNAFKVAHHANGTFRRISAAAFCQHFRIAVEGTILFSNPEFSPDGLLTLDLTTTTKVSRGAR